MVYIFCVSFLNISINCDSANLVESFNQSSESALFWSAFGSFAGVIVFYLFKLAFQKISSRKQFVRRYLCASELNLGNENESPGELMHHHGRRISDFEELKIFKVNNPIWEWTLEPSGSQPHGASIIYGPYSTDFIEPGVYSVVFKIQAMGLQMPVSGKQDSLILELDVNVSTPDYSLTQTGEIIGFHRQQQISKRYLRISDLAKGGWVKVELSFYSDAQGIWEYRIMPFSGHGENEDFNAKLGNQIRIVFDQVLLYKNPKFHLPSV